MSKRVWTVKGSSDGVIGVYGSAGKAVAKALTYGDDESYVYGAWKANPETASPREMVESYYTIKATYRNATTEANSKGYLTLEGTDLTVSIESFELNA
jgi:hypothetical protein